MRMNVGTADKAVRLVLAVVIALLYFTGTLKGALGITLLVLAGIFFLTSLIGFCPLYALLHLSTRKKETKLS